MLAPPGVGVAQTYGLSYVLFQCWNKHPQYTAFQHWHVLQILVQRWHPRHDICWRLHVFVWLDRSRCWLASVAVWRFCPRCRLPSVAPVCLSALKIWSDATSHSYLYTMRTHVPTLPRCARVCTLPIHCLMPRRASVRAVLRAGSSVALGIRTSAQPPNK